ncbi:MAG TPA: hypothetical protein DCY12_05180 [Candidatus Atribacteria bacterium]|nr:hypothetical protein [Candidatus Atribacteria bacterium]
MNRLLYSSSNNALNTDNMSKTLKIFFYFDPPECYHRWKKYLDFQEVLKKYRQELKNASR